MQRRVEDDEVYDEEEDVPLHHRRPFGAGIQRKPIQFVKASDPNLSTTESAKPTKSGSSVGDFYLSLVLPSEKANPEAEKPVTQICAVCDLPLGKDDAVGEVGKGGGNISNDTTRQKHEASIAHQVCLTHSHPPSALDRSRMGLTYLSSHGWDPDSRKGLGAVGQGIQYPLKTKPKEDKYGLGLDIPKDLKSRVEKKQKPQTLDAKKCRKKADEDKKKAERLRQMFYGSEAMDRYLGSGL
ncbi:G-patch domain-containing protein [Colletotrichum tofieldiae]|uniref:G-patch domain-containing protein n=1 Tax=Colletotrichum tofieldiae TaxID=708197 RepID=A0A166T5T5_9PEZI|nr:G-patch domain-containing protein [Colletotrichum tofieldiae]GKT59504.1 G-patch domain-containing protein [Colletotrichum tofieldiae]GKT78302.1 G-patch domain-containing protein [Colletotrichum tofieldiae]GKT85666.1 G-patch domain-containing protein [Colletotrichum tofieldiae]